MLRFLGDLSENPTAFFVYLAAFATAILTGLAFHEFSHAWAANELGDDTAKRQGRLTLNPIAHLDPIGTALLLFVGFGWAKPTPVNPWRLRIGPIRGNALVAFAGPLSNFFFAALAAIPIRTGLVETDVRGFSGESLIEAVIIRGSGEDYVYLFLLFVITLNVLLGIFNLIPIPPLDGFKVATGFLPKPMAQELQKIEPYGPGILMVVFMIGFVSPSLSPVYWLINLVYDDVLGFFI
jgi:Zn-dependent protease